MTCPAFVATGQRIELVLTTAVEGMPADQQARDTEAGTFFVAETTFAPPLPPCERLSVDPELAPAFPPTKET